MDIPIEWQGLKLKNPQVTFWGPIGEKYCYQMQIFRDRVSFVGY